MQYMQIGAEKFERKQPMEFRRVPFTAEEIEIVPGAVEAIGWVFIAFCLGCLFVGFLGM